MDYRKSEKEESNLQKRNTNEVTQNVFSVVFSYFAKIIDLFSFLLRSIAYEMVDFDRQNLLTTSVVK